MYISVVVMTPKKLILFPLAWIIMHASIAQQTETFSDLRVLVDSIIRYEIGYLPDSTTDVMPSYIWDTTQHRGMPPSFSSFTPNPMTAISLDGRRISMDELNAYQVKNIANIQVFPKDDARAVALLGSRAANGLILIETRKTGFFKKGKRKFYEEDIEKNLFAFIGKKISVNEFDPNENNSFYTIDSLTNEIIKHTSVVMDRAFRATYQVIQPVFNDLQLDTIEFIAYDHYGRPAFENYPYVILYLSKAEDGQYFHQKGLFNQLILETFLYSFPTNLFGHLSPIGLFVPA